MRDQIWKYFYFRKKFKKISYHNILYMKRFIFKWIILQNSIEISRKLFHYITLVFLHLPSSFKMFCQAILELVGSEIRHLKWWTGQQVRQADHCSWIRFLLVAFTSGFVRN